MHHERARTVRVLSAGLTVLLGGLLLLPAVAFGDPASVTLPAGTLVVGGGFEPPGAEEQDSYSTLAPTDSARLGGWTVTVGSVDLIGKGWGQAAEGNQYLDLNGNTGSGDSGAIEQQLQTPTGHRFRVQFYLAANPNGDAGTKSLTVTFGTDHHDYSARTASTDDLGWSAHQFEVVGCQQSTALRFTSNSEGERGPMIDAVSVVDLGTADGCGISAAPPLWQILMLAGTGTAWVVAFVYLGMALQRRRALA